MAEWLGKALQKLLQRFESASDLKSSNIPIKSGFGFQNKKNHADKGVFFIL